MSCWFSLLPLDVLEFVLFPLLDEHGTLALMVASNSLRELVFARPHRFGAWTRQSWIFSPSLSNRAVLLMLAQLRPSTLVMANVHPYRLHSRRFGVLDHSDELQGARQRDVASLLERSADSCCVLWIWAGYLGGKISILPRALRSLRLSVTPVKLDTDDLLFLPTADDLAMQCPLLEELDLEELRNDVFVCGKFQHLRKLKIGRVWSDSKLIGSPTLVELELDCFVNERFLESVGRHVRVIRPLRRAKLDHFSTLEKEDLYELVHEDAPIVACPYCGLNVRECCLEDHFVVCFGLRKVPSARERVVVCPFCLESLTLADFHAHINVHNRLSGKVMFFVFVLVSCMCIDGSGNFILLWILASFRPLLCREKSPVGVRRLCLIV